MKEEWYRKKINDIYEELKTKEKGLTEKEAELRLKKNGKNILPKSKKKTILSVFLHEINNPIVYILTISLIFSLIVGEIIDGIFILIVVLLDGILGTIQEWKANNNAESLKKLIKIETRVIRDGRIKQIESENLVIGDIIILESGSKVPADIRLIKTQNLIIDESLLTGESIGREKNSGIFKEKTILNDRTNMAYLSTSVTRGRALGVVVATGSETEIGKLASSVLDKKETPTPLQTRMNKFTRQLGLLIGILGIIISSILYFKGYTGREIFFLVVALSVSAIPEGLPVVLTLVLSIASNKMAKKNVLVKKLNAVEALGSVGIIASDKTGTLTLNEQTVKKIILPDHKTYEITGVGYNKDGKITSKNNSSLKHIEDIIKEGIYNNEAHLEKINNEWVSHGDSMDIALLALGYKYNLDIKKYKNKIINRIPYESDEGYSAAFYEEKETKVAVKGTLEKILNFSKTMIINGKEEPIDRKIIRKQNEDLAREGYRVLAFASGTVKEKENYTQKDIKKLTFLGLVAFIDPIRNESKIAIEKCKKAGIKTIMITGDHPLTALRVAKELNIAKHEIEVVTGLDLENELIKGEEEFDKFIKTKKVFARVTPTQKLKIVESYKRQGEFIAVTGDGVNDAPALKAANVGVAMGSGTDVAKETGTLIITDDNFKSIVNGVEEGRNAYDNIRKVTYMLLSCALCEVIFFILSILLNYEIPLTAIQLLWLNLVTDGIQDVALAFESGDKNVMEKKPRKTTDGLFDKLLIKEITLLGITMGIIVFLLWVYLIDIKKLDIMTARSYTLLLMVFIQNLHCFNCRSELISIFKKPLKENKVLLYSILVVLIIQLFVVENSFISNILDTTTLPLTDVISLFILALPITIVSEIFKYHERKTQGGSK